MRTGEAPTRKFVVITATDVDEVPSVKAADGTTEPDAAHMVEENSNLLDETTLTAPKIIPICTWRSPPMMMTRFHCC